MGGRGAGDLLRGLCICDLCVIAIGPLRCLRVGAQSAMLEPNGMYMHNMLTTCMDVHAHPHMHKYKFMCLCACRVSHPTCP